MQPGQTNIDVKPNMAGVQARYNAARIQPWWKLVSSINRSLSFKHVYEWQYSAGSSMTPTNNPQHTV